MQLGLSGGEGSTAREVLKHKSVELCVMVDIDEVHLPGVALHMRTLAEPRLSAFCPARMVDFVIACLGNWIETAPSRHLQLSSQHCPGHGTRSHATQ